MHSSGVRTLVLAALICTLSNALAADEPPKTSPKIGQPGKDIVWLPTSQLLVERMLGLARVTSDDYLIDLGSGDGRIVIAAAKRGAKALGVEYNPELVQLSRDNAAAAGVSARATFVSGDLFQTDFSPATVITMFLHTDLNLKLRPRLLELKPGTRIVSNSFTMGEWQSDEEVSVKRGCFSHCTAYLWIIPAKVQGIWHLADGTLELRQTFQLISGTLVRGVNRLPISHGIMDGEQILFTAGETQYTGRVIGNTIDGGSWKATRVGQ